MVFIKRKIVLLLFCIAVLFNIAGCFDADSITTESAIIEHVLDFDQQALLPDSSSSGVVLQDEPTALPDSRNTYSHEMLKQAENLHKLCKVWGFLKYTHLAFLTGEKDWDDELLNILPHIRFADGDEVNEILFEWYESLGDDGYDHNDISYFWIWTKDYSSISSQDYLQWIEFWESLESIDWLTCSGLLFSYT